MLLARELGKIYAAIDQSVALALSHAEHKPVCQKGCEHCCRQPIPLSQPEAFALFEYVRFALAPEIKAKLLQNYLSQQDAQAPGAPCPLLLNGSCQAYQLRPIACRRFMVGRMACGEHEDPAATRPEDLIIPARSALNDCLLGLSGIYEKHYRLFGMAQAPEFRSPVERIAWIKTNTAIIQAYNWQSFFEVRRKD